MSNGRYKLNFLDDWHRRDLVIELDPPLDAELEFAYCSVMSIDPTSHPLIIAPRIFCRDLQTRCSHFKILY